MFFFFFSSRRRHTRFSRDWSSDVCSSDLAGEDRRDRDGDEQEGRHQQRRVELPPGDRPSQEHLQRATLALAGDRAGRKPHREDRVEDERDGMDQAEADRARQAEDVALTELGELLWNYSR